VGRTGLAAVVAALAVASGCGDHTVRPVEAVKPAPQALAFQEQLVKVVRTVSPTVVQIQTSVGLGSGVVYDGKGDVVTNAHVVGAAKKFTVTLADGTHEASLVGAFPADDLAVIRLEGEKPAPASFADSSKIDVGDIAIAIGNPLGLRSSVTQGIVSSLGRTVSEGNGVVLPSVIQTSADINPGNSGGALVDISGRVIGIPTLAALDPQLGGTQAPGIGFAIPSNTVKLIADQLIEKGRVERSGRASLGVRVSTIVGGGVLVASVVPGGPAAKAGIKPGDVILAVGDQETPTTDVLVSVLAQLKPDLTVPLKILHPDGHRETVDVTLGELSGG
jgi:putative serine protease PepD